MPEKLFKVIVVGDPTVGKTAFVQRYVSNIFKREFKGTVGVDFSLKILNYSECQTVKLQLWDIAGNKNFVEDMIVYSTREGVALGLAGLATNNTSKP